MSAGLYTYCTAGVIGGCGDSDSRENPAKRGPKEMHAINFVAGMHFRIIFPFLLACLHREKEYFSYLFNRSLMILFIKIYLSF